MKLTINDVENLVAQGESVNGGWSRKQLALLGVSWPPETGWKDRLVGTEIDSDVENEFINLKDQHIKGRCSNCNAKTTGPEFAESDLCQRCLWGPP